MTTTDETCGDYGGTRSDGEPCTRPAAWGRDADTGCCKDHVEMGRPTKLTYENQEKIAGVIEQGGSISEAARKAGVHRETIGRWMQRGQEQENGIFADFYDRLTRARGEGEGHYRQALMQIAIENDDTATLMTMLKQRYPETWGDVKRGEQAAGVTVNTQAGETVEVDPDTLEVVSNDES